MLPPSSTEGESQAPAERLDADVLILTYVDPAQRATLEADPLFRRLPSVRRGAYVAVPLTAAVAMAFGSALSIPHALQQVVPALAKALSA